MMGSLIRAAWVGAAMVVLTAAAQTLESLTGVFTDARDGKKYRTVKIGRQIWMRENLNYKTDNSRCYDNKDANCQKYGRLYDWNDARKACPADWRLPSDAEWDTLMAAAGGSKTAGKRLKSQTGWAGNGNGMDELGYAALPGGYGGSDGKFYNAGDYGFWWSATEYGPSHAWSRNMRGIYRYAGRSYNYKTYLFSARCVRND